MPGLFACAIGPRVASSQLDMRVAACIECVDREGHPRRRLADEQPIREESHGSSFIRQASRPCRCGVPPLPRRRRSRRRAVDAEVSLACTSIVPEGARHDLRRRRDAVASASREATDGKFQIQVFAGRRDRAGPAGGRRGAARHRRDVPHRVLLLLGQGPDLRLRHGGPVRPQRAPA